MTRADFDQLTGLRPKKLHGRLFSLSFARDPLAKDVKAACVISKKTAARAADRNRIRRRCREILRSGLPLLAKGTILVLYAKKDAVKASFSDMKADIEKLLKIS